MKTTLSFDFNSLEEARAFLQNVDPSQECKVSAAGPAKRIEEGPAIRRIEGEYESFKKADLVQECTERGIEVSHRSTKTDLVALLTANDNGGGLPFPEAEPEVEAPQVSAPVAPEPVTPVEVAPAPAAPTPAAAAVDREGVCAAIKNYYQHGVDNGIEAELLSTTLTSQLVKIGHAGQKIGDLPDAKLMEIHALFTGHVNHLIAQGTAQPAPVGAEAFM